jgi:two-component system chemotaxis response regulator CheB
MSSSLLVSDEIKSGKADCVVIDYWLHQKSSEKFIIDIHQINPTLPIILLNNSVSHADAVKVKNDSVVSVTIPREPAKDISEEYLNLILKAIKTEIEKRIDETKNSNLNSSRRERLRQYPKSNRLNVDILAIGSSTGGPVALEHVLNKIPSNFPLPVVVTQHMPPVFTKSLSERLDSKCPIHIKEAEENEILQPGICYIAPGNFHMAFKKKNNEVYVSLNQSELVNSCRPSVDVMFDSLTEIYQGKILAVILTGMGFDGTNACKKIKVNGGHIVIQNKETCVVWGMPKGIFDLNLQDEVLPILEIGEYLVTKVMGARV